MKKQTNDLDEKLDKIHEQVLKKYEGRIEKLIVLQDKYFEKCDLFKAYIEKLRPFCDKFMLANRTNEAMFKSKYIALYKISPELRQPEPTVYSAFLMIMVAYNEAVECNTKIKELDNRIQECFDKVNITNASTKSMVTGTKELEKIYPEYKETCAMGIKMINDYIKNCDYLKKEYPKEYAKYGKEELLN